ncbi:uncharacterized protein LOC125234880 [Leguminivora glycinivorella]|uniref:uncharacterized protein LOC125234880 n=1 Tax=Leguminivora glycinivorella TaxID=1035111 RepID=UPI00200C803B|nr:uncharacterized protein LOC125234880 [Leguminivora glycinivorella]
MKLSNKKRYLQQRLPNFKDVQTQRKRQPLQDKELGSENCDHVNIAKTLKTLVEVKQMATDNLKEVQSVDLPNEEMTSNHGREVQEYEITTEPEKTPPGKQVGRRIVDVSHFTKKLLDICNHGPIGCSASDIELIGEKQKGLMSSFKFICKMCKMKFFIENDVCQDNYLNLNACAVAGTIAIGCGRSQLEELLSAMNVPNLSENVYKSNHDILGKQWEKVFLSKAQEAAKREKEIAVAEGNVTKEGGHPGSGSVTGRAMSRPFLAVGALPGHRVALSNSRASVLGEGALMHPSPAGFP